MNAELVALLEREYPDRPFDPAAAFEFIAYVAGATSAEDRAARLDAAQVELAKVAPGVELSCDGARVCIRTHPNIASSAAGVSGPTGRGTARPRSGPPSASAAAAR